MQDEAPPWADSDGGRAASVDAPVLAGVTIWLVAFGWYVVLGATPRGDLTPVGAAYVYGASIFLAGLSFGVGEDQLATVVGAVLDTYSLVFGGLAVGVTALAWFQLRALATGPYVGGLWLGVLLFASGIALGVAAR